MPKASIAGWGKYVPETILTNDDLANRVDTSDEWIQARTGIRERRVVADGENCSDMAVIAARKALDVAQITPEELDLIIVATSSPDYLTPPVSSQVQEALGVTGTAAFTLVTGCTGFVYGLVAAQQFVENGAARNVLIIGVELISRMLDWEDRNTCVLFGDGAAAVVLQASETEEGVLSWVLGSDGKGYEHIILPSGGTAYPPSEASIAKRDNYLRMNGREVFKFATRIMVDSFLEVVEKAGHQVSDVDLLIPHQANARIIEYAAAKTGLPPEKVFINVSRYGNTSAASVPIALCEALEEGRIKSGSLLAFVAFGAGLTWAAALVRWPGNPQT